MARLTVAGNEQRIVHIRERLLEVLKELCDPEGEEKQLGEQDAQRWTLTAAFVPAAPAQG